MEILSYIFAAFAALGALDKITGDHFGLGKEFERGILSSGMLTLAMVGMITLSPAIAKFLLPVAIPVANFFHFDPSAFVALLFSNDGGGASIAKEFCVSEKWGAYNGLVACSMVGLTTSFTIPFALKTAPKKYHKEVILGILCGVITIPLGLILSAVMLSMPFTETVLNLAPIMIIAGLTCIGLWKAPDGTVKVFSVIGAVLLVLITLGLGIAFFSYLTKINVPYTVSLDESFQTVLSITAVLTGVFPMMYAVSKILEKPLSKIGKNARINNTSVMGIITSSINSIPTLDMIPEMDKKGIVINMAFAVSGGYVFGDHLAFTMGFNSSYVPAVTAAKVLSAVAAIVLADMVCKKNKTIQQEV